MQREEEKKRCKNMLINKEILKSREDWRIYYILEYLRENKYLFNISSDDELLNVLYFVYQNNKEAKEVDILNYLYALECAIIDKDMKLDNIIVISLDLLYSLDVYAKMRELEKE